MPVEVGLSVSEEFVVDSVRMERGGETSSNLGHVFQEMVSVLVRELVQMFCVPFQGEEGVSLEGLVRVELRDTGFGLVVY